MRTYLGGRHYAKLPYLLVHGKLDTVGTDPSLIEPPSDGINSRCLRREEVGDFFRRHVVSVIL